MEGNETQISLLPSGAAETTVIAEQANETGVTLSLTCGRYKNMDDW